MTIRPSEPTRIFLATTALSEFWLTDREMLFLSTGCLSYDNRDLWSKLNYSVLSCPWENRARFQEATNYLEDFYERALEQLSTYLNNVHNVSFEKRYWRLLIGPWLLVYVHAAYDRYNRLLEALMANPQLDTLVLEPGSFTVPHGMWDFMNLICNDAYNLQICSQILQSMGYQFPAKRLDSSWSEYTNPADITGPAPKTVIKKLGQSAINFGEAILVRTLGHRRRIGLCDMYLSPANLWRLALRTRFRASPIGLNSNWSFKLPDATFDNIRNGMAKLHLHSTEDTSEFERIFVNSLPNNLPVIYLEGYREARSEISQKHSKFPSVITSSVGWYYNDVFKFLAAEATSKGSRLVSAQHGGTYGIQRFCSSERHENTIADNFMVWGWAGEGPNIHTNLPSPKISAALRLQDQADKSSKNKSILFVNASMTRYLIRFDSFPVGDQIDDYLDWILRFLDALPDPLRDAISCRPNPGDQGWSVAQRISKKFPSISWDNSSSYEQSLKNSRIAVIDNPVTTYMEALASNVPTVLFWNEEHWEMRDEAQPFFDGLRSEGILHLTPENAAEHVALIYDEPQQWWKAKSVQTARQKFIDQFASGNKDWRGSWARALIDV